jgi:IS5 family transposase
VRKLQDSQQVIEFHASHLKVTNDYFARYEAISLILDENPQVVALVHADLERVLKSVSERGPAGRRFRYTAEHTLRILICQCIEGASLRDIVIRIDDSTYLRRFTRIHHGLMMDFSTLCTLKNAVRPETWKLVNEALAKGAVARQLITGEALRLDTTAVETNIHWPTDSGLLWDTYRVLARSLERVHEIDPDVVEGTRLQVKKAKKIHARIHRKAGGRKAITPAVKEHYQALIELVGSLLDHADVAEKGLKAGLAANAYGFFETILAQALAAELRHYIDLGRRVVDQATRRVLKDEQVPASEKLYSIFEPHTELLMRGKAGKPIEFGHMILLQQVPSKFITDYKVFDKRPVDHALVDPAILSHRELFGDVPDVLAGDKGFYQSMGRIHELTEEVELISIGKKGKRNKEETARESTPAFKKAQRFRAGIEGTISFLKRGLRLFRCMNKGWSHYVATVGMSVFAHNLLILARGGG